MQIPNKKIYILTNTLLQGGAEKQSVLLAKNLKVFYDVTMIIYYGKRVDTRLLNVVNENNINIIYLKGNLLNKFIYLISLFKSNKKTVIISYLATTNIINAVIGAISGVKYRIGGIRSSQLDPFKLRVQRFLHNKLLSHTVCNNYSALNYIGVNGFKLSHASVIHNSIEVQEKVKKQMGFNRSITILTVGRFVPEKDFHTTIHSFKVLLENQKPYSFNIKLIIIGYGEQENYIRNLVNELNLSSNVEIYINPANLRDYYKNSDIYLSTSLFEGLSNSIMEAMEFSLPVVATNVGDNKYLVLEGESGFLLPVGDTAGISDKLKWLIENPDKRKEFGIKSYLHIKNNFSEEEFTKKYITLIEGLCNE